MGRSTGITATLPADIATRITTQLAQLTMLTDHLSTAKQTMFGLELELWVIDKHGQPIENINVPLTKSLNHPLVVLELGGSQLEFNVTPVIANGAPFTAMLRELQRLMKLVNAALKPYGAEIVFVGTLPTLDREAIKITDATRYQLVSQQIWKDIPPQYIPLPDDRQGYRLERIDGLESLIPATSCQGHLLVPYQSFVVAYNTTLATAPIVHAMATNASIHLGKVTGADIRSYLFSGASRGRASMNPGYITDPLDPFRRSADLDRFSPILAVEEKAKAVDDVIPSLHTLRLHLGTVWDLIVRAVYEPDPKNPHIRLELRYPSAQPTLHENLAVFAFAFGLILNPAINRIYTQIPYERVLENFENACRFGPKAAMWWPNAKTHTLEKRAVSDLALTLLPAARDGLLKAGVDSAEADVFLETIQRRAQIKRTGSVWQTETLRNLENAGFSRQEALTRMFSLYRQFAQKDIPLDAWPLVKQEVA